MKYNSKIQNIFSNLKKNSNLNKMISIKNFITVNNIKSTNNSIHLNNFNLNFFNYTKSKNFHGINKNFYCETVGNLVILNGKTELKIPFEKISYSIFYNKNDTLKSTITKISGISEKIQNVEFYLHQSKEPISEELKESVLLQNFINSPFKICINKYLFINYIPGIFPELFSDNQNFKDIDTNNPDYLSTPENIKNSILVNFYNLKNSRENFNKKNFDEEKNLLISEIISKLDKRKIYLEDFYSRNVVAEKIINNKLIFLSKVLVNSGLLFAFGHFTAFYLLIYKFYAWDIIEPITYIIGNVYWIITLGFLAFGNKRLEFEILQYDSVKSMYLDKYSKLVGFNEAEKSLLEREIKYIEDLKNALNNF